MPKLPKVKAGDLHIGCATCSSVPGSRIADMGMSICVGFGSAYVTRDAALVYDGESELRRDIEPKTLADIEAMAAQDPDSDWRVVMCGPLHGETYQRQGRSRWVMVDSNQGFA